MGRAGGAGGVSTTGTSGFFCTSTDTFPPRRRSIETDIAHATEQSTEQFRTGMKAFLYSCLVAAVGAVDEHAKTTLDGLKDPAKALREGTAINEIAAADAPMPNNGDFNNQSS